MEAEKIKTEKTPILIHDNGQVWYDEGIKSIIKYTKPIVK